MSRYWYCHYVYVIENAHQELYIGRTSRTVAQRLEEHRAGKTKTTAKMKDKDFHLVHFWTVSTLSWSSKFEQYLQRKKWSEVLDIVLDVPMWCHYLRKLCWYQKVDSLGRFHLVKNMDRKFNRNYVF